MQRFKFIKSQFQNNVFYGKTKIDILLSYLEDAGNVKVFSDD